MILMNNDQNKYISIQLTNNVGITVNSVLNTFNLKQVFPKTPLQTCIVHYQRNLMKNIRPSNKQEFGKDLKEAYEKSLSEVPTQIALSLLLTTAIWAFCFFMHRKKDL